MKRNHANHAQAAVAAVVAGTDSVVDAAVVAVVVQVAEATVILAVVTANPAGNNSAQCLALCDLAKMLVAERQRKGQAQRAKFKSQDTN